MAEICRRHTRQPHPQNHRGARLAHRTGAAVRTSGGRIGRSPIPLSAGEERDDGAQHARHDPAFAAFRSGSAHHPGHDRGAGAQQIPGQGVTAVLLIVLALVVLMALAFALSPLWRAQSLKGRSVLAAAIALFLLGVGGGTYFMLGQPYLAWRTAQGVNTRDINGLIALLIKRVRQAPDDQQAWTYLARAYMSAGDAGDA